MTYILLDCLGNGRPAGVVGADDFVVAGDLDVVGQVGQAGGEALV